MQVTVVGSGIAGLAAAVKLRERLPQASVTVLEHSDRLGGKLCTGELAGTQVELGSEAFLAREPDSAVASSAVTLARRVGISHEVTYPEPVPPALALAGELRPLPWATLLGIPSSLSRLTGIARPETDRDQPGDQPVLAADEDVPVGTLVGRRLGAEVVRNLVDPVLGGVYAARAEHLSLAATAPSLAAACRHERTLTEAVRAALSAAVRPVRTPVLATVRGGLSRLVEAAAAASQATIQLDHPVRHLRRVGSHWQVVGGAADATVTSTADAVVLAVPAGAAARLLATVDETAAVQVGGLDYASVALTTLAYPSGTQLPPYSGLLVPPAAGTLIRSTTFFPVKWAHLRSRESPVLVRAWAGRYRDDRPFQLDDAGLVRQIEQELGWLVPGLPEPMATQVQRWPESMPQYAPGHQDRVAAARRALPVTLQLAGAGYDGVGVPSCVRSGERAAEQIIAG